MLVDEMLGNYFKDKTALNDEFVNQFYKITSVYPKQLLLDKFNFDVYGLLVYGNEKETSKGEIAANQNNEQLVVERKDGQGIQSNKVGLVMQRFKRV